MMTSPSAAMHITNSPTIGAIGSVKTIVAPAHHDVRLGRIGFALVWMGIYTVHAISVAYLIVAGQVYTVLPTTQITAILRVYDLTIDTRHFVVIAFVHYLFACIHGYFLARPIVSRLFWVLTLTTRVRMRTTMAKRMDSHRYTTFSSSRPLATLVNTFICIVYSLRRLYRLLFGRQGFFGVHSGHFELYFLTRELIETVLQTYQAYMMSRLMPRAVLNDAYTLILVINCWITPVLKRLCRGKRALEQLLIMLCDTVLDFVASIGVPALVAIGYIQHYDPITKNFTPWSIYYDDVWFLNYLNEGPIVLFGSWLDAVSRFVFSLGLLSSLANIKALVDRRQVGIADELTNTIAIAVPRSVIPLRSRSRFFHKLQHVKTPLFQGRLSKWVHRVLAVWGFGIAMLHVEAHIRAQPSYCSLALRPWLVSLPACAIVTINCRNNTHLTGDAVTIETVFQNLEASAVEYLIFRHCPHIELTPRILTFCNLYGVKTYNSTIYTWPLDAALTTKAHPRVRFSLFVRTHFINATVPLGLRHEQFPSTLTDIEITMSNIKELPSSLPWQPVMFMCIEFSQLDTYPPVFAQIQPLVISVAFNHIAILPAEALMSPRLAAIFLLGNPIQTLPEVEVDLINTPFHTFSLEYTNISSLPAWVTDAFVNQIEVLVAQTPLCVNILQNQSSPERDQMLQDRPWLTTVEKNCANDPGINGYYPLNVDIE